MTNPIEHPDAVERVDTAELRALLEKATPGPWAALRDKRRWPPWRIEGPRSWIADLRQELATKGIPSVEDHCASNAALIVAAVNALPAILSQLDKLETENAKFRELDNDGWFTEIAEFLDDYQDAEIIDGTTHPNKAMRLLCKLQELGL